MLVQCDRQQNKSFTASKYEHHFSPPKSTDRLLDCEARETTEPEIGAVVVCVACPKLPKTGGAAPNGCIKSECKHFGMSEVFLLGNIQERIVEE